MNVINELKVGDRIKMSCGNSIFVTRHSFLDRSSFEWVYTVSYLDSDYLLVKFSPYKGDFIIASYESIKIENE